MRLGALLYQLVTARPPFVAPTVAATLELVRTAEPVAPRLLNPEVPRDLETICLKCLLKEPERRYASAAEWPRIWRGLRRANLFWRDLSPAVERVVLWCRRKPTLAAVSVALIVALILGIAGIVWQWRRAESSREEMRRNLYAADLAAASGAVRDGNLGQARRLLGRYRSQPGSQDLREFTWRMLSDRGDELTTLGTHPGVVTCVAISPDGQWAASGSQNPSSEPGSALRLWRLPGLAQGLGTEPQAASSGSRALPVTGTVWSVAFTPDSRTLVSAGTSGLRTWEVVPGGPTPRIPQREALEVTVAGTRLVASANHPFFENGSPQPLWWCDWTTGESGDLPLRGRHPSLSPDGRRLAYLDATHDVRVVEVADPSQVRTVSTNRLVFRLRFSPDGRYLAAAGQVTSARVWDLADWNAPGLAFEGEHNVWDAAFSADGTSLFTATSDQRIELWDMERRARTAWLEGHANEVWTVVATPDGRFLVSGSKDGTVRLWSAGPPSPRPSLLQERQGPPRFNTDGSRVLTQTRSNAW
jgi:WD40 repeat protein